VVVAVIGVALVAIGATSADGQTAGAPVAAALATAAVRPAYQGHFVTADEVAELQAQGLAEAPVLNRELACQGVELYFDTADERDAYLAGYVARYPVEPPYLAGDPCRPYRDSPRFATDE
jgi:hypothetical protein